MANFRPFSCEKCQQVVKRLTLPRGERDGRFMVVGDAPGVGDGAKESYDMAWRDGRSSEMLESALLILDIYEQCWFTNQLKCATPCNRPSFGSEIHNCRTYLDIEYEVVKPEIVILLGAHVAKTHQRVDGKTYAEVKHPAWFVRMGKKPEEYARHIADVLRERRVAWE